MPTTCTSTGGLCLRIPNRGGDLDRPIRLRTLPGNGQRLDHRWRIVHRRWGDRRRASARSDSKGSHRQTKTFYHRSLANGRVGTGIFLTSPGDAGAAAISSRALMASKKNSAIFKYPASVG